MKINRDTSVIFMGNGADNAKTVHNSKKGKGHSAVVFAGGLNLNSDKIEERRKQAQKQALRIVGEAFDGDKKIDDELNGRRERVRRLNSELSDINKEISSLEQSKKNLRESMGIKADSEEQRNLMLLEKRDKAIKNGTYFSLTEEEKERLKAIDEKGLTDYQKEALEINSIKEHFEGLAEDVTDQLEKENKSIELMKQEMVKNTSMLESTEQAEDIMEAASEEIKGMLIEDAKEHMKEEEEKRAEEAEKLAEKKEEKEKTEEKKEVKEAEELLKKVVNSDILSENTDIKQKIQEIIAEAKLNADDILGAAVDVNI